MGLFDKKGKKDTDERTGAEKEGDPAKLPSGYEIVKEFITVDGKGFTCDRIKYKKTNSDGSTSVSAVHPNRGALPEPWYLRTRTKGKKVFYEYYDKNARVSRTSDPRESLKYIARMNSQLSQHSNISANVMSRNNNKHTIVDQLKREEIQDMNIRDRYYVIKTIDDGGGGLGAMNGGVFVTCLKERIKSIQVEKRFKASQLEDATPEIRMLHKMKHNSLSMYTAAFIETGIGASVYVEYCDLGSIQDLINIYRKERQKNPKALRIPETFIWHAFIVATSGLAYLQSGRDFGSGAKTTNYTQRGDWTAILHRDVKPDNFLLRSRTRSDSLPYCILSDFGLMCEDEYESKESVRNGHAKGSAVGTVTWFAPELLYPEAIPTCQEDTFYMGGGNAASDEPVRHTAKSDLWAVAACIYNMAYTNIDEDMGGTTPEGEFVRDMYAGIGPHLTQVGKPERGDPQRGFWYNSTLCRRPLPWTHWDNHYSKGLRWAINFCSNPRWEDSDTSNDRPDPIQMMWYFANENGFEIQKKVKKGEGWLPGALRIHDMHNRAETAWENDPNRPQQVNSSG